MTLIVIAEPWSESELSVMLCTLESRGIPTFVRGAGFGSLYPGPQIAFYNTRRIMVPDAFANEAREVLAVYTRQEEPGSFRSPGVLSVLRAILELVIFGWCVSCNPRRLAAVSGHIGAALFRDEKPKAV